MTAPITEGVKLTSVGEAVAAIEDAFAAEAARADSYLEALRTLYVNAIHRDGHTTLLPFVAPICLAAMEGRSIHDAIREVEAGRAALSTPCMKEEDR